ncbi:hypothetical protein RZS08_42395, partial [Arthrospira platensis SPKY1]|nr:hypothetical protein [Arthrospira platensis SPKY1]
MRLTVTDRQGRVALLAQTAHRAAKVPQGVHQVADRALMHAGNAAQLVATCMQAGPDRQRSRQRAHGRARVAQ